LEEVRNSTGQLGYVRNRADAKLRSANASLIGLVINHLRTPFLTKFATSFQIALADHGYAPVLAYTDKNLL
jgi:LacI family transcriptional regulator